jgi:nucleotide-binding universal stress UspA family protein
MPKPTEPIKKIAVAIAGKSANPQVVHEAVRLAGQLNAKLYAVHISYPSAGKATFMMDAVPLFTEDDVREHIRKRGYKDLADSIPVKIYTGANPAKLLARVTKSVDMLVVGHKHRNRILQALTSAPVQQQIMDVVECPVLVVPPKRRPK